MLAKLAERREKLNNNRKIRYIKRNYDLYYLLIPALVFVFIFNYLPLVGIGMAFVDYNIMAGNNPIQAIFVSDFVGLQHFINLFNNPDVIQVIINTLRISILKIIIIFPLPIILALLLNEVRLILYKRVLQTVLYLPRFLSWAVVSGIFTTLLSSTGAVNIAIQGMGGETIMFLIDRFWWQFTVIFTDAWKEVGWGSIIYLAAITSVDPSLYEAAMLDGAGRFKQTIYITLPSIMPTIVLLLILRVSGIMEAGFEQIFILINPVVRDVGEIIGIYVWRMGLGRLNFSMGSAFGLINSVIAFSLVISCNGFAKKFMGRSIW